jgi:pentalenolactone synthase
MCALISVPFEDFLRFRHWTSDHAGGPAGARPADGMRQLMSYADRLVRDRRRQPGQDMLSALVSAGAASARVHDGRVTRLLAGMLAFGWETPASIIDTGLLLLLGNPEQRRLLQDEPLLAASAVEEVLRLSRPPVAVNGGLHRYAHADVAIGGVTFRTGDLVMLDLMAANRDSDVFPAAERFLVSRDPNPHLSFGHAFYLCNFARLARAEVSMALTTLLGTFPGLRLAEDGGRAGGFDPLRDGSPAEVLVTW